MAEAGYEDIDRWNQEQKSLLQQQQAQQQDITNRQTELAVKELARQKEQLDKDTVKATRGLYTDYQKQANQYGVEAERQAQMGLRNSGYSETAQTNLYNGYQKNVTETLNNANTLKANFDNEIARAREQGSITMAQNALELYKQQMQLLSQEYEMRNNRRQFLYQQDRDRISDSQWQKQYDAQQNQWQQQFDYQKQRDAVADSQWEKQYALSKKASTRSSSSSRSRSSKKKSSSGGSVVNTSNAKDNNSSNEKTDFLKKWVRSVIEAPSPQIVKQQQLSALVKNGDLTQEEMNKLISAK